MEIEYTLVKFEDLDLKTREATKIRGYFANKHCESEILHNHKGAQLIYEYPKVQYKIINTTPMICGIEEGAKLVADIGLNTDEMILDGKSFDTFQKEIIKEKKAFRLTNHYLQYKFITPWIALNQKNNKIFNEANDMEKEEILKKIIVGNILSMAKGLKYTVDKQIHIWIDLKECAANFKNIKMRGFKGNFKVNFMIPDYLGLGKSVSRGFGTIKRSG
ncbi:CRISPR-associated endonuclease Cas6 [Alkaliphilus peptidifermentans]|uniref:DNA repair protein n=1 Tax=Alkaliphilus peptidifermentans DSM 18978 TaxID=1120976 RepID=A0A1G5ITS8_9FIRM|nr:CRISPR-associated endonuclease Cas6 [Alkaliphilus peptidifermentans]SCY79493.1 hypothetical protein SAMN03080606_02517 [Alkaliphilus peptidifermentans DSM 18978]